MIIRNELYLRNEIPLQSFCVCVLPDALPEEGGCTKKLAIWPPHS